MSNHEIGHAFSELIDRVLELHDQNEISDAAARNLISLSVDIVCGEDGNAGEATEGMDETHCSCCLKPLYEDEAFVTFRDADNLVYQERKKLDWGRWWNDGDGKHTILGQTLCIPCFRAIFTKPLGKSLTERIIAACEAMKR